MDRSAQPLAVPRSDLGAATVGIEPVPARFRVLGFFDYFVLWADLGVGLLVLLAAGSYLVPGPRAARGARGHRPRHRRRQRDARPGRGHRQRARHSVDGQPAAELRPARQLPAQPGQRRPARRLGRLRDRHHGPGLGPAQRPDPRPLASYPFWALGWGAIVILLGLGGPLVVVRQWLEKVGHLARLADDLVDGRLRAHPRRPWHHLEPARRRQPRLRPGDRPRRGHADQLAAARGGLQPIRQGLSFVVRGHRRRLRRRERRSATPWVRC